MSLLRIILIILLLSINSLFSQEKQGFELKSFYSDSYYYNGIILNDEVYVGTSEGVFKKIGEELILEDQNLKGPIVVSNNKIVSGRAIIDNSFNYLLPYPYNKLFSSYLITKEGLLVFNKGNVFEFQIQNIPFEFTPSVRSISDNYLGTYEGIFNLNSGEKLDFPSYTSSFIKEYNDYLFINWDGLLIKKDTIVYNFYDPEGFGLKIKDSVLGYSIDVIESSNPEYLLSTSKGIYNLNIRSEEFKKLIEVTNGEYNFISQELSKNSLDRMYIHDKNAIYSYTISTGLFKELVKFNQEIVDVYSESGSQYYVLFKNALIFVDLQSPKNNYTITEDLIFTNNVIKFNNILIITSDIGLDLFDISSKIYLQNVITDEFNQNAYWKSQNELKLGSVNGYYTIPYTNLVGFFSQKMTNKSKKSEIENKDLVYLLLLILFSIVIILLFVKMNKNEKRIEKISLTDQSNFQEKVRLHIKENINDITVSELCKTFEVSTNSLYSLMGNKKPGDIIRSEKLKIVRKMRRENASEEEIAKATGFSISYLKKI
jgi:hypothetical protein